MSDQPEVSCFVGELQNGKFIAWTYAPDSNVSDDRQGPARSMNARPHVVFSEADTEAAALTGLRARLDSWLRNGLKFKSYKQVHLR